MNHKTSKMEFARLTLGLPIITLIALLCGCGDRYDTIQPPGADAPKSHTTQVGQPSVNINKTRELFSIIAKKELGDKEGRVEMRNEGILIHPGDTHPTSVSFKLSRKYQKISVRPFIAPLPADALKIKEAGTVGVEFLLDGKSAGRFVVNRDTLIIKKLDLTNVSTLTAIVDNGDGKPWFDWLMLGVVEAK